MFQIDILARTDLLGPLTAILSGCYWCPSLSITPRDVGGPSGSLRGLWIVISLDARRLSGCKRKSSLAPVSVSSALNVYRPSWSKSTATYSSLASFSNLQWDEFRDLNYPFSRWSYFFHAYRPTHTRGFAPGACSRGTLREQSSSMCANDFMGILHPREKNFHPAKCSTIFIRLNTWEQAPLANNAPSCVLTRAKWSWSILREQNPSCVSALLLRRVGGQMLGSGHLPCSDSKELGLQPQ